MFAYETQIVQRLAFLVVCHDLAVGHILLLQKPMSWFKAQEFCQRHFVDLPVLSTEEQYFTLLNATASNKTSFWLGLHRESPIGGWKWVSGEELSYDRWYRRNYECRCASLEAMLENDKKLLARYCDEQHMVVCQGPVSPRSVTVDSLGSNHVLLSWNISAFMQMTPHSYNVTTCTGTCDTDFYASTDGSAFKRISISNLTSATTYHIEISAFVRRLDSVTGRSTTLQSTPTALQVRTVDLGQYKVIILIWKSLWFLYLIPLLWILYCILKKRKSPFLYELKESDDDTSPVELPNVDTVIQLFPERTRAIG